MKRIALAGLGGLLAAILVGAGLLLYYTIDVYFSAPNSSPDTLPQVVAVVNNEAITGHMVETEIKISRLNLVEPLPPLAGEDLTRAREEAVNQLVTRHLILQAAARQNFFLDEVHIKKRVDLLFGTYGDETLDQALAQAGATRADLRWWVREISTVEEFITEVIMADAAPEQRQEAYNAWLNTQRAAADVAVYLNGETSTALALVGDPAPDFTLASLDGQPQSLADYRGRVVLVNFWATWCPSCISEMPDYEKVYQEYGQDDGDFVVLGVNFQERPQQVAEYAAGLGLSFPVLLDREGVVSGRQYLVTGMPASFIIDRQGLIYYRHLGPMSGETLKAKLSELGF